MTKNNRAEMLIYDIDKSISLPISEWEVWSGEFNRHLRGLILCAGPDDKQRFRFAFSYWQTQNKIKNNIKISVKKRKSLLDQLKVLKMEAIWGEKK